MTETRQAEFDPKVKAYIFLYVAFALVASVVGIVALPFWLLGVGQVVSDRFFHTLKLRLTPRQLLFSKGLVFRVEKTIPLENIQDVSFMGGPVLRAFGLTQIQVETAGGGGPGRQGEMSMIGVVDAESFKAAILDQRQSLLEQKHLLPAATTTPVPTTTMTATMTATTDEQLQLLRDIKQELIEIKQALVKPPA